MKSPIERYLALDSAPKKSFSLAEHDKLYHPGGYKPGDRCKVREELAKGDEADLFEVEEEEDNETETGKALLEYKRNWNKRQDDFESIGNIRDRLAACARLLNKSAGNLSELQSDYRWKRLKSIPGDASMANRLLELSRSTDKDIAKQAAQLEVIRAQIAASAANNWADTVGKVPRRIPGEYDRLIKRVSNYLGNFELLPEQREKNFEKEMERIGKVLGP